MIAQLVDLSHADVSFLNNLADDLVLLAGSHTAWCDLLQKTGSNCVNDEAPASVG